jgi:hypothetical protein
VRSASQGEIICVDLSCFRASVVLSDTARLAPGKRAREATMNNPICSSTPPPLEWSVDRRTHPAIAQAIFAVSSDQRTPEAIWESPTPEEWRKISELVVEYVDDGDFAVDNGKFAWGPFETLRLWPAHDDD